MTSIRPIDRAAAGSTASEQQALEAAGVLARAGTALRHCLEEVHTADDAAWAAYSEAADAAIAHLQAELVLAGARLNAERAADHDEVRDAAFAASHVARQWLDDLRVQAHLGRMEAGSAADRAVEDLEHVARGLRAGTRRLGLSAAGTADEVRCTVADAIHGAGRALMVVAAAARSADITFEEERRAP